jgi:hypothetical protein
MLGLGGEALLDRVYVAVRGADWSTVPGVVSALRVSREERSFSLSFAARHQSGELDFAWRGHVSGAPNGTIECHLEGEALSDFDYCRIGWCVHHPSRLAGAPYRADTAKGQSTGTLPRLVAPQMLRAGGVVPPLPWFERLAVTDPTGAVVRIESDGEPFELEDQRNWTDASFKSYVPPIRPGYPYRARRGQRFDQRIRLHLDGPQPTRVVRDDEPVRLELGPRSERVVSHIGLGLPEAAAVPAPAVLEGIARLQPDHLRLLLRTDRPDALAVADAAMEQAQAVSCALEVVLITEPRAPGFLKELVARLIAGPVPVARWLVFDADDTYHRSTSEAAARLVRGVLDMTEAGAVLGAGTASDFVRLNRGRTLFEGVDALAWAIDPSFHAHDDRSVMENAGAQGITVETARAFCQGRALWVGPVELSRHDRAADPRQRSAFAAAWTVASLADLCLAGPDSVTYFETVGPRGVLAADGEPYPVHAVLEQVARMRGGRPRVVAVSVPHEAAGLVAERDGRYVGLVANLTDRARTFVFEGFPHRTAQELGRYEVVLLG